jgi:uncharacterized membrane protein YvlD (DUF360 family)
VYLVLHTQRTGQEKEKQILDFFAFVIITLATSIIRPLVPVSSLPLNVLGS